MNYQLIHNHDALQSFVDFLPDLKENEGYFLILIARKKWWPESELPSATKLKRETVNCKSKIVPCIQQWEIEHGMYRANGRPIYNRNLGVYIGFNPKNQLAACYDLINKCLAHIKSGSKNINVKSAANDVIQGANGSKNFIDIDVDIKEGEDCNEIIAFIKNILPVENLTFIKTNGGFHCLVHLNDNLPKNWYQQITNHTFKSDLNIMPHDLVPVVGCNQGQFVPYFFN